MKVSVAAVAAVISPEIGESIIAGWAALQSEKGLELWCKLLFPTSAPISRLVAGEIVEQSMKSEGLTPPLALMTPSLPR